MRPCIASFADALSAAGFSSPAIRAMRASPSTADAGAGGLERLLITIGPTTHLATPPTRGGCETLRYLAADLQRRQFPGESCLGRRPNHPDAGVAPTAWTAPDGLR